MDSAYVHLVTNHLPVVGTLFSLVTLTLGILSRSEAVKRAAMALVVVSAVTALPAYFSGEEAEEAVEKLPGVEEPMIETHEELGEKAFAVMMAAGALALGGLALSALKGRAPTWAMGLIALTLLASTVLMGLTAKAGGVIRHTEIREPSGAEAPVPVEDSDRDD